MWKFGPGSKILLVVLGLAILGYAVDRYFLGGRFLKRTGVSREAPLRLTAGDFPAGAAAPATDVVRIPTRALRVVALARGSAASLLLACGGVGTHRDAPMTRAYGVEVELSLLADERAVLDALTLGGDRAGGADAATVSVDRFAQLRSALPDAKLKAILLLARSRGHEALAGAPGVSQVASLRGRKVAVPQRSPARFFLLWELSQVPLSPSTLEIVPTLSSADAARLFREGRVEAAAGMASDLAGPAKERAGSIIATSADAPQLVATILIVRAEFLARFPDAVRRLVRAILDASESISRDPIDAARLLTQAAPQLGDPFEAIRSDPPALLAENLAFFDIRGDTPVRYEELFKSAADLWRKMGEPSEAGLASETRELGPLVAASAASATSASPKPGMPPGSP